MRTILTSLFIMLYAWGVRGDDNYNYIHFSTRDGLAGDVVYTALQDHNGFIWFCTETGLSRFDGRAFRNFTTSDGLPSNEVFGGVEDTKGRIWIKTFTNEVCYYFNGRIYNRHNDALIRNIILPREVKGITLTTDRSLIIYDALFNTIVIDSLNRVKRYKPFEYLIDIMKLVPDRYGAERILALPKAIERKVLKLLNRERLSEIAGADASSYNTITLSSKLFANNRTAVIYNVKKGTLKRLRIENLTYGIFIDNNSFLALRSTSGALLYNIERDSATDSFLDAYAVNGVLLDKEQNIWFCSNGDGVFKLGDQRIISCNLNVKKKIPVQSILEDHDQIYVNTVDGLSWFLLEDNANRLYVKAKHIPYLSLERLKNIKYSYLNFNNATRNIPFGTGYQNLKSAYFFSDSILYTTHEGTFVNKCSKLNKGSSYKIFPNRCTGALKERSNYYIGTLDGLFVLNEQFHIISHPFSYRVSYLSVAKDHSVWIATYGGGVFQMNGPKVTDSITAQRSNISSDLCRCVYLTQQGIWVGTDKGLNFVEFFHGRYRTTYHYSSNEGLNSNVINAIVENKDKIYVGTAKGLNIFQKRPSLARPFLNLLLTDVIVNGKKIFDTGKLILPHWNNQLKVEFSAISFSLNNLIFRYRLVGMTDAWQTINEQSLNFLSLPSGNYTLQLQAMSPLGYKSNVITRQIKVKKAVFEEWWFLLLTLSILITSIYLVITKRIKKIRSVAEEKSRIYREIARLEQTALKAQMTPHFIFNCLNSVQRYILKQDIEGANHYLSEFAGLVRKTLENAPRLYITLREEISYLNNYIELERMQSNTPFLFTIKVADSIDKKQVMIPNMILQPFVENAIKHGLKENASPVLTILFEVSDGEMLSCIIQDNGKGIEATKAANQSSHRSQGIAITSKRIETINQISSTYNKISVSIIDLQQEGQAGTKVHITIPLTLSEFHNYD